MVPGSTIPGGPLMTWVQPEASVMCWILLWGGGFLRRVIVSDWISLLCGVRIPCAEGSRKK